MSLLMAGMAIQVSDDDEYADANMIGKVVIGAFNL